MSIENQATTGEWTDHLPVVVAVDGSERNRSAVAWAAHEAAALGRKLTLVTAVPDYVVPTPHFSAHAEDQEVREMLERVRAEVQDLVPADSVHLDAVGGDPVDVLLEKAGSAGLVVVGKRGLGGFARLIVGSTSIALAGRSSVPVAIVPDEWDPAARADRPVVVGIDLDKPDHEPIEVAFRRAERLGVLLVAVHGWETPAVFSWDAATVASAVDELDEEESRRFDAVLAPWREHYPNVTVRAMRLHKHPAAAVLEAAQEAQVVVLGRHPAGTFGGFAFGSVARAVLHYSECPVIVVPADENQDRKAP